MQVRTMAFLQPHHRISDILKTTADSGCCKCFKNKFLVGHMIRNIMLACVIFNYRYIYPSVINTHLTF